MATKPRKPKRAKQPDIFDRTVVYYGIKIPPFRGKMSPTAKAIREALRAQVEPTRGKQKRA